MYDYVTSPEYPAQHTVFNALHIFDKSKGVNLYGSEFSMNAEIYGYKFNEAGWYHEEQNLTFVKCRDIASQFNNLMQPRNKVAEFQMTTYLNAGVTLPDLINLKQFQIEQKYNIPKLNDDKLTMYKRMIGAI